MDNLKYFLLMVLFIIVEIGLTYGLYQFVISYKWLFVVFSLLLLIVSIAYIVYGRYREKIKLKPKKEVSDGYKRFFLTAAIIMIGVTAVLILFRAVVYLIQ